MKLLEWNNLIGDRLFNVEVAGQEVYLFLGKQDIVNLGRASEKFPGESDENIWKDFLRAIRLGFPGESINRDFLDKMEFAYNKAVSNIVKIEGVEIKYPPYLAYLLLTVLPIIESSPPQQGKGLRDNNYYARVRKFLRENNLPSLPNQNQSRNWNHIWEHLSHWSTCQKKTDLGVFTVRNFSSSWVYAGIPISQCLIDPKALKKLPEVFLKEELIPDYAINDDNWRNILRKHWTTTLKQRPFVLSYISKPDDDLGKVVIEIVKNKFKNWNGELDIEEESSLLNRTKYKKKVGIRARLYLSFRLDKHTYDFKWGCRMYSSNDYPEDLLFNGQNCYETRENWSNQLETGFVNKIILKDLANKWEASLPEKDIRLFVSGAVLNLNSEYWVETEQISRIAPMRLLCKGTFSQSVKDWGKHFHPPGRFKQISAEDYGGIPEGWELFEFQYPNESFASLSMESSESTKKIVFSGGLKVGPRTYLHRCLPDVIVENSCGDEAILMKVTTTGKEIHLQKKYSDVARWTLPDILNPEDEFIISFENSSTTPLNIAHETLESLCIDNSSCPTRNKFGMVDGKDCKAFVKGSLVHGYDFRLQEAYKWYFHPNQKGVDSYFNSENQFNQENSLLLEFLTRKKVLHSGEFFEAFEKVLYKNIPGELEDDSINLTWLKRQVINWYDFLGYIDFDYQSKRVVVNPPQMFLIPTPFGRKAFLTGARTSDFEEQIFNKARQLGLQIEVVSQAGTNKPWFLLPDTLIVNALNLPGYGLEELKHLAKALNIYFDPDKIAQWGLLHLVGGIQDYAQSLCPEEGFEDWDWSRKVFIPESFRFVRTENSEFDKSYTLVEYQFNAYTYRHILWINDIPYAVDKSWARWLVLKHHKQQVVFIDQDGVAAIPTGMPLPRLISEALMLCSGKIPEQRHLKINGINASFTLYGNVVKILLENEFSKIGQNPIQLNKKFISHE